MKRLLLTLLMVVVGFVGCSSNHPTGSGDGTNSNYYHIVPTDTTKYVNDGNYTAQGATNLVDFKFVGHHNAGLIKYKVDFNTRAIELTVISSNTNTNGNLIIQIYDSQDFMISTLTYELNGDLTQKFTTTLPSIPDHIFFDVPSYDGNVQIVIQGVAY